MQERTKQHLLVGIVTIGVILVLYFAATWVQGAQVVAYPTENAWTEANASRYNARAEHRLWDDSRCDLLNDEYAIEVDWSNKWTEGIGQCEWYGIALNRKPGLILLVKQHEREKAYKDLYRATAVTTKLGIRLWIEEVPSVGSTSRTLAK
jgi:hypothetical protein